MQLNELLQRLKSVRSTGQGKYTACCPAHDDNNPSLSVGVDGNNILLKCFAGCTNESIVGALGLEMKDLFIEENHTRHHTNGNGKPKREIVAVYDYMDLNGKIVHSTIRYNPKGFSQRRPNPDKPGDYIWKDVFKGISPILYNLQAVNKSLIKSIIPRNGNAKKSLARTEKNGWNIHMLNFKTDTTTT